MKSFEKDQLPEHCGRLCGADGFTHIVMRVALIEGDIIERLEHSNPMTLRQLIENLKLEPCAAAMAVGSLIRQGLIRSFEHEGEVVVELVFEVIDEASVVRR